MSQETISNLVVELGLDTKNFNDNLKQVNSSTKLLEQNFNGTKKALALSERSFDHVSKAISSGEQVIKSYATKINALGNEYKQQENKLKSYVERQKELPDAISKAETKLKELEQSLGKSSEEYKKQEHTLKTLKQEYNGMDNTLAKTINSMRSLQNQIQQTETKISQAETEVKEFRGELEKIDDIDTSSLSSMFEGIDIGNFTGQIEGADGALDLLSLGAKGAGIALAGIFVGSVINGAIEYDKVITDLKITMGVTEEKADNLQSKIMSFSDGGYNIEDIASAVELLSQRFNMTDIEMERVSQGMSVLNRYGYETNDMVRFITMAYDSWGMTATDAIGMIIRGQQEGLNINQDLMETFTEYTPIFGQMGLSGQDAFNLMSSAMRRTGMDSDKVADMMKELTLTITDGSTASSDALASVGIDVDDLKSRLDSGKITMSDAFKEVSASILGMSNETDRATALQDIFKGTVEYGNQNVLDAWVNVQNATLDTSTAIDEVTTAYENSYQASQQDFSNSWDKLTETIGSAVLPILTSVIDVFNNILDTCTIIANNFGLQIQTTANQFKAFFIELGIGLLELFAKLPFAESIMPNLKSTLDSMKTSHEETIKYIQNNEQLMKDNASRINGEYKADKEQTFNDVKTTVDAKTKEMTNVVDINTKDATNKSNRNLNQMATDASSAMGNMSNVVFDKSGNIPKAVQVNMNASVQTMKQNCSDMYNGCKNSFTKLSEVSRQSMTNLYKGVGTSIYMTKTKVMQDSTTMYNQSKKSFNALASAGISAFSNLYNGVTTLSSRMKNQVLSDWNAIRNTLSKGITGRVTMTRTNVTQNLTKKITTGARATKDTQQSNVPTTSSFASMNNTMASLRNNIQGIDFYGASYQASPVVSKSGKTAEKINNDLFAETQKQNKLLTDLLSAIVSERNTIVENTINLDGRQIARSTAKYMETEFNSIKSRKGRLSGAF